VGACGSPSSDIGGRLAQAGRDVTFLVRPRRAAELAERGLRIHAPAGETVVPARTVTAGELDEPYDLIVLAVKSYHLQQALADLGVHLADFGVEEPAHNGMRHIDTLVARFGADRVYGGVCMIAGTLTDEGDVVQLTGLHRLLYGPLDGARDDRLTAVAEALSGAEFESQPSAEIVQEMWEKWAFIATAGGITCLMRGPVGDIVAGGGAPLVVALYDEIALIAAANGHPLRPPAVERAKATLTTAGSPFNSSMARDVENGFRTEAEHVVGDLLKRAKGGAYPVLTTALAHLRTYRL